MLECDYIFIWHKILQIHFKYSTQTTKYLQYLQLMKLRIQFDIVIKVKYLE